MIGRDCLLTAIGTDIISVKRIKEFVLLKGEASQEVFTVREMKNSIEFENPFEFLSLSFSIKESVFKATGWGWQRGIRWTDVEAHIPSDKPPQIIFQGEIQRWLKDQNIICYDCFSFMINDLLNTYIVTLIAFYRR
ncbi:MAG: 4'-phosphopantetheinyl transferase superfamily protein [Nitrospinae bacterium]|nr:4'-phosphopantetheinyl transferase superfamily protein [Nitrospinota bacterium]MBI3815347.1 4'-phosphopantetheinyl transferase superfamily protein [Nitrospinota bacterium]